jgi:hypothetical protein
MTGSLSGSVIARIFASRAESRRVARSCWRRCSSQDATVNCSATRSGLAASRQRHHALAPVRRLLNRASRSAAMRSSRFPACGRYSMKTMTGPVGSPAACTPVITGAGQSPAGSSCAGGIAWNRSQSPARGPIASATPMVRNVAVSPACCAIRPNTALPTALPPWNTIR